MFRHNHIVHVLCDLPRLRRRRHGRGSQVTAAVATFKRQHGVITASSRMDSASIVGVFAYDYARNGSGYDARINRPCSKCGKPGGGTKAYETVDDRAPLCVNCVQADWQSYALYDRMAIDEIIEERVKRERRN